MDIYTIGFIVSLLRDDGFVTISKNGCTIMPMTAKDNIPAELLSRRYETVSTYDGKRIGQSRDILIEEA